MIFNKSGKCIPDEHIFIFNGKKVEITDQYQYLGVKLRPSGSMDSAVQELNDKATRAWYGISNIIYRHKRMEINKALNLFDSLISPVCLYATEFWLPYILPKKCFKNRENLLHFWENFQCETINQRICRMVLAVHNKTSCIAVLSELGRYPMFVKSLSLCLNYKLSLYKKPETNLVRAALTEMEEMSSANIDCWLTRVHCVEKLLKLPHMTHSKSSSHSSVPSMNKTNCPPLYVPCHQQHQNQ